MTTPTKLIDHDTLAAMRAMLAGLTPKPKTRFTSREAVTQMAAEIRRARDKLGYTLEDIALMLQGHGHAIKPDTLRGYLRALETAGTPKPRPRTPAKVQAAAVADASQGSAPDDAARAVPHG